MINSLLKHSVHQPVFIFLTIFRSLLGIYILENGGFALLFWCRYYGNTLDTCEKMVMSFSVSLKIILLFAWHNVFISWDYTQVFFPILRPEYLTNSIHNSRQIFFLWFNFCKTHKIQNPHEQNNRTYNPNSKKSWDTVENRIHNQSECDTSNIH